MEDVQKEVDELRETLQCPVCLDVFKKPVKLLPCLHSFCFCCLVYTVELTPSNSSNSSSSSSSLSASAKCSVCRRLFPLSQTSDNELLNPLIDRLASLTDLLESEPSDLPQQPSSSLSISPESQEKRDELSELVDIVEARHKDIESSLSFIDLMETKIQEMMISEKDHITTSFDDLIHQIEQRKQTLLVDLETKSKEKLDRLAQQRKQLEADLECLENSVTVSRSFIKNATDDQFSNQLPLLSDQLTRLKQDERFLKQPVEVRHPELLFLKKIDLDPFLQNIVITDTLSHEIKHLLRSVCKISNYKSPMVPILSVGSYGNTMGCFVTPQGITSSKGEILVCDSGNHRVQIFDTKGHPTRIIGRPGTRNGEFNRPCGIAVDRFSRVIVCDTGNQRVQMFDELGNHLKTFGFASEFADASSYSSALNRTMVPSGIVVNKKDRIVVSDAVSNLLHCFDLDGQHLWTLKPSSLIEKDLHFSEAITLDKDDNILVCDTRKSKIHVFDPHNGHIRSIGSIGSGPENIKNPTGVAVDQLGNVVVSDSFNNRLQVFDPEGNHLFCCPFEDTNGSALLYPSFLAFDLQNNLLVTFSNNNRFQMF